MLKYIRLFGNESSFDTAYGEGVKPMVSLTGNIGDRVTEFKVNASKNMNNDLVNAHQYIFRLKDILKPDSIAIPNIDPSDFPASFNKVYLWEMFQSITTLGDYHYYVYSFTLPDTDNISSWNVYDGSEIIGFDYFDEIQVSDVVTSDDDMLRYDDVKKYLKFDCSTINQETYTFTVIETNLTPDDIYLGNTFLVKFVNGQNEETIPVILRSYYEHSDQYLAYISGYNSNGSMLGYNYDNIEQILGYALAGFKIDKNLNVYYFEGFIK